MFFFFPPSAKICRFSQGKQRAKEKIEVQFENKQLGFEKKWPSCDARIDDLEFSTWDRARAAQCRWNSVAKWAKGDPHARVADERDTSHRGRGRWETAASARDVFVRFERVTRPVSYHRARLPRPRAPAISSGSTLPRRKSSTRYVFLSLFSFFI